MYLYDFPWTFVEKKWLEPDFWWINLLRRPYRKCLFTDPTVHPHHLPHRHWAWHKHKQKEEKGGKNSHTQLVATHLYPSFFFLWVWVWSYGHENLPILLRIYLLPKYSFETAFSALIIKVWFTADHLRWQIKSWLMPFLSHTIVISIWFLHMNERGTNWDIILNIIVRKLILKCYLNYINAKIK